MARWVTERSTRSARIRCAVLSSLVWASAPLLWIDSGTAHAEVLWIGDFETGDVSQWDGSNLLVTGERDNLVFVHDVVREGTTAAQITLREDIIFEPYTQSRVEVKHQGLATAEGDDSYIAWFFMVPDAVEILSNIGYWESNESFRNTMSFSIIPGDGGESIVKFGTGNLGETERWRETLVLGEWHRLAMHVHWSQDPNVGNVSVWYDGEQVVDAASVAKYDGNTLFWQMGLHRSDPAPPVQTIYIDGAMEASTLEDILAPVLDPNAIDDGAGGMSGAGGSSAMGGAPASQGGAAVSSGGSGGDMSVPPPVAMGGAVAVVEPTPMPMVAAPSTGGAANHTSGGCVLDPGLVSSSQGRGTFSVVWTAFLALGWAFRRRHSGVAWR
jgi:hypothetical protein